MNASQTRIHLRPAPPRSLEARLIREAESSVPRPNQLPELDEWPERKLARAVAARAKGHRLGTICCRSRGYRRVVPNLRTSGDWLKRAGFEIEVRAGRLTIRAV